MVDKVILKDRKHSEFGFSMGAIAYQKAYESLPHSPMLKTDSIKKWTTVLECGVPDLASVQVKRGIYLGDSLSPQLLIICLIPLCVMLRDAKQEYTLNRPQPVKVNHMGYMDDRKILRRNKKMI